MWNFAPSCVALSIVTERNTLLRRVLQIHSLLTLLREVVNPSVFISLGCGILTDVTGLKTVLRSPWWTRSRHLAPLGKKLNNFWEYTILKSFLSVAASDQHNNKLPFITARTTLNLPRFCTVSLILAIIRSHLPLPLIDPLHDSTISQTLCCPSRRSQQLEKHLGTAHFYWLRILINILR